MKMFRQARADSSWPAAKMALEQLKTRMPGDPFIVQQLALATYKGKQPDKKTALAEAKKLVSDELQPQTSNDPETLGIWGSIHKQLWEMEKRPEDLDESIRSYGKGFHLKDDYYNGINYAFMLNVRAGVTTGRDAIADFVWAERVRHRVIELCEERLAAGVKDEAGNVDREQIFWLRATLIEALIGTGQLARAESIKDEAIKEAPESWMHQTLEDQVKTLNQLLANAPA
jgi:tetratricopeptide (TPR) repeat protein